MTEMRLVCSLCVSLLCLILPNGLAFGELIDTLEDIGADGSAVSSRSVGGVTIAISTASGTMTARTYNVSSPAAFRGAAGVINTPLNPTNVSLSRFISTNNPVAFEAAIPITFEFSSEIAGFGLTTIDLLENSSPTDVFATLTAFDSSNNVLDTHMRVGTMGLSGLDLDWFVSSGLGNIARVELSGGNFGDSGGYGIDDFVVVVPEPSAFVLFGLGTIGLVTMVRRRTKRDA